MSTIKNIEKLQPLLADGDAERLEAGALQHKRFSNIIFTVLKVFNEELHVRTEQGKSASGNYADIKTLIARTRELFAPFVGSRVIHVQPVPYRESASSQVTPEWLQKQMLTKSIRVNTIAEETGVDQTNISAWLNGIRPMSQPVKAMFWFYFMGK